MNKHDWNTKQYLDHLYYDIGKQKFDFLVSGLWRNEDGDRSTKWYKYSTKVMECDVKDYWKLKWINQRQIFPNEIIIDLEERLTLPKVVRQLLAKDYSFKIFDTGSRGFHIHMFFNKDLTEEQKLKIIKLYGGDEMMAKKKHLINLEWSPHWKSKKIKREISIKEVLSKDFK